jgi:uncharacterized protein (DUF111 family)
MSALGASAAERWARLHVEAVGGAAGDMLLGALFDLGAPIEPVRRALASIDEPGLSLEVERVDVAGERACHVRSLCAAREPHGRHLDDILTIVGRADMTPRARDTARRIFELLAVAEAECHGERPGHVHLHEVGELDSILDVVGIAIAYDALGAPSLAVTPLPSGHGTIQSAHGLLPVPAPAVRVIVAKSGLELVEVSLAGETVTPTGAAALAVLATEPRKALLAPGAARGVGAGQRRFADRPNVVRVHGYRA